MWRSSAHDPLEDAGGKVVDEDVPRHGHVLFKAVDKCRTLTREVLIEYGRLYEIFKIH